MPGETARYEPAMPGFIRTLPKKNLQLRHHTVITAMPLCTLRINLSRFRVLGVRSTAAAGGQRRNCVDLSSYLHRGVNRRDTSVAAGAAAAQSAAATDQSEKSYLAGL